MSGLVELLGAVLATRTSDVARQVLAEAARIGVDPFDYCTARLGLPAEQVMARAAAWAGLGFAPTLSVAIERSPRHEEIDGQAGRRTCRSRGPDGELLHIAPTALELLQLKAHLAARPGLARRIRLTPPAAVRAALALRHSEQMLDEARRRLRRCWPYANAHNALTRRARAIFLSGLLALVMLVAIAPFVYQPLLLPASVLLLVAPAGMRWFAAFPATAKGPGAVRPLLDDAALPIYSVLIPLRNEAHMVPQLVRAMLALDYPREKLDIKFVVEARSEHTVAAVRAVLAAGPFELVLVPDQRPRTKPKAMNYALPLVRGQHVVVFDAEDIPDRHQLRLAASRFAADPAVECLQAELVIDNAEENWLSALFAGEYAGLFGLMLPALSRWRLPMPLGGTSNHFRVATLRRLGGWDAYNVTEDADLGVRLARLDCRCATLAAATREEAPITVGAWMNQRTRWMKGWMQTFIVHNRHPRRFLQEVGWRAFLGFEVYVGGLIVSALLHTIFMAAMLVHLGLERPIGGVAVDAWTFAYALMLVFGYTGALTLTAAGLVRLKRRRLLLYQWLLPIYWVLHGAATLRAAYELVARPFYWSKTAHGRSRQQRPLGIGLEIGGRAAGSSTSL